MKSNKANKKWIIVLAILLIVLIILIIYATTASISGNIVTGNAIRLSDFFKTEKSPETATTTSTSGGKPPEVVNWSNGFPSGEHYNLNIHGKKSNFICDATSGGGSIFVPEYGQAEIQLIQNRKSSITGMYVIDPCSFSMQDPAKIQLPYGEYQVYTRILAKPGKRKTGETRSVIFYPKLIDACNDNATAPIPGFGDYIDCSNESLVGLGVITSNGVFDKDSQQLIRISPVKGQNKAQDVTAMFQWTGYACDEAYDTNDNGEIDIGDVSVDYDLDGTIDSDDLAIYLDLYCFKYNSEWIFNIADLVVYGWDYYNSGSKLVQVRFYPKKTTTYI